MSILPSSGHRTNWSSWALQPIIVGFFFFLNALADDLTVGIFGHTPKEERLNRLCNLWRTLNKNDTYWDFVTLVEADADEQNRQRICQSFLQLKGISFLPSSQMLAHGGTIGSRRALCEKCMNWWIEWNIVCVCKVWSIKGLMPFWHVFR